MAVKAPERSFSQTVFASPDPSADAGARTCSTPRPFEHVRVLGSIPARLSAVEAIGGGDGDGGFTGFARIAHTHTWVSLVELVDSAGCLKISLYHGTSTLFAASIGRTGLGAETPLEEWQILPLLRDLIPIAEHVLATDDGWLNKAYSTLQMADQTGRFRHRASYLTASKERALQYARRNPQGSELISRTMWLIDRIEAADSRRLRSLNQVRRLRERLDDRCEPALVVAHKVPLEHLREEGGGPAEAVLGVIDLLNREGVDLQDVNASLAFEATAVIPPKKLEVFRITTIKSSGEELVPYFGGTFTSD